MNIPPVFSRCVMNGSRQNSGPVTSTLEMCIRPNENLFVCQFGWGRRVPDPAFVSEKLGERRTTGKTAKTFLQHAFYPDPSFTGSILDRTRIAFRPLTRALVVGIGPSQNLMLR